jgi:hypothetical protein
MFAPHGADAVIQGRDSDHRRSLLRIPIANGRGAALDLDQRRAEAGRAIVRGRLLRIDEAPGRTETEPIDFYVSACEILEEIQEPAS